MTGFDSLQAEAAAVQRGPCRLVLDLDTETHVTRIESIKEHPRFPFQRTHPPPLVRTPSYGPSHYTECRNAQGNAPVRER